MGAVKFSSARVIAGGVIGGIVNLGAIVIIFLLILKDRKTTIMSASKSSIDDNAEVLCTSTETGKTDSTMIENTAVSRSSKSACQMAAARHSSSQCISWIG